MDKMMIVFLAVALVHTGCIPTREPVGLRLSNVDADTGNLIAFWMEYPDRPEYPQKEKPVIIERPYAVFMQQLGNQRRFLIYDNVTKKTFKTVDFDAFVNEFDKLPHSIEVLWIDTCTVSQTHEMSPQQWYHLKDVMSRGNRKWFSGNITGGMNRQCVCTCESTNLRFP